MSERKRDWVDVLVEARRIVKDAGRRAQKIRDTGVTRLAKSHQDFVTEADLQVEQFIRGELVVLFPGDRVFGEEGRDGDEGDTEDTTTPHSVYDRVTWVLDPVDGTSNFAAGLDTWCVSLGAVRNDMTEIAVIYAPDRDEEYTAIRGGGAWLNGEGLAVSRNRDVAESLIMTGRGAVLPVDEYLAILRRILEGGFEYRRYGSGALGIAMVATGTIQGYIEMAMWPWDVAAARLIVAEAGGYLSPFPLDPLKREPGPPLVACQPGLEDSLMKILLG
ncbi:MAG: inositol monophosphatase family protein [Alkalispirochaeta sp.]